MRSRLVHFLYRIVGNMLGLWIAARLFVDIHSNDELLTLLLMAIALAVVNAILRPIVILLSLPAIVFSLGLFIIIINGFMVWLASVFVDAYQIESFGPAVLAGMIIGLVNYAMTAFLEGLSAEDK